MAYLQGQVVNIPPLATKIPDNPLLGYPGARTAPASTAKSSRTSQASGTQSTIRHRVLLYDQRCFLTGAVSIQLEACHLVNAIRMNAGNRAEKEPKKKQVEYVLTRQQFGLGDFFLDSLPNCIAMEAQWHGDLDTHGSFCITVPLDQILAMILKLEDCNREWQLRAKSNPNPPRNLVITEAPFVVKKCVLLVLRPELFLPEGRPLLINTRRVLRKPGGPSISDTPSWTQYTPRSNSPYLVDPSGQEFEEFDFVSERSQEGQRLSIFSLLVNANAKLQAAKRRKDYPTGATNYITNIEKVIQEIFFVPPEIRSHDSLQASGLPPLPSGRDPSVTASGPSTRSSGRKKDNKKTQGRGPGAVGGKDDGLADEEHLDMDTSPEHSDNYSGEDDEELHEEYEEDYDDEEYDEEDDEPDTINGLTYPEMETVIQRASDGTISAEERAEAAMLMLGMAGGHKRPQAVSPLIQDYV